MIENITELESSLKLPAGTLKAAIENADNVKVEIPQLVIRTADEDTALRANLKTEFGSAAVEIAVKKARETLGLDFTGKTIDNLVKAVETKTLADAKIEPNKKIVELESDLVKVRGNLTTLETQLVEKDNLFKSEKQKYAIDSSISSKITGELILPKEDIAVIFKSKYSVEFDDAGKEIIKKGGEVLKNGTTLSPLTMDDVMKEFLPAYSKTPAGGAGGADDPGKGKAGSREAFDKEMKEKNINVGSTEYNRELNKRVSEKTLTL